MIIDFSQPYTVSEAIVFPEYTFPGPFPIRPIVNPVIFGTTGNVVRLTGTVATTQPQQQQ